jgi:hypothetical protein
MTTTPEITTPPNKISKTDVRYESLKTIPMKEYDTDHSYVYLRINDEKDYYMVSINATIQTQILWYSPRDDDNRIVRLWAHEYTIPTDDSVREEYVPDYYFNHYYEDYYQFYVINSFLNL